MLVLKFLKYDTVSIGGRPHQMGLLKIINKQIYFTTFKIRVMTKYGSFGGTVLLISIRTFSTIKEEKLRIYLREFRYMTTTMIKE